MEESGYLTFTFVGNECARFIELNRIYLATVMGLAIALAVLAIAFALYVRKNRRNRL